MKFTSFKNTASALVLGAALSLAAVAAQASPVLDGGWTYDQVAYGNSLSDASPYVFTLSGPAYFSVTDAFVVGDTYTIFNNTSFLATSSVGVGGTAFGDDAYADSVWTSGNYSTLQIVLGAGSYSLNVFGDCYAGCPSGFYTRLDTITPPPPSVPLPAALPLILTALGGLGLMSKRRKSA